MDEGRRREVQDAVRHTEEQWRKVLQEAEEALSKADTDAATEQEVKAFRAQNETAQSWIREQKQKLMSPGGHVQPEERLQVAQVSYRANHRL